MTNSNKIDVWPKINRAYWSRQNYIDAEGNEFQGTQREALQHYRNLYPSKTIDLHGIPRKRNS